ncbi:hypothetical protein GcC1_138017 [Golovinomyces cichoracearum]|uniref:Uncharacterized protein n=1 Tax=Golovinomyces cichoracearum TaxID=62708 RepID=A0A420I1I7_9PEZI|nr:hypothetical protein GcC1_138017 [Golovinomyces cichoracearum]
MSRKWKGSAGELGTLAVQGWAVLAAMGYNIRAGAWMGVPSHGPMRYAMKDWEFETVKYESPARRKGSLATQLFLVMSSKYCKTITASPNYRQRTYYSKIRKLTAKSGNYCDELRSSSFPKYQKGTKRDKRRRRRKIERRAMSSIENSAKTPTKRVLEEAPLERPSKTTKLQSLIF